MFSLVVLFITHNKTFDIKYVSIKSSNSLVPRIRIRIKKDSSTAVSVVKNFYKDWNYFDLNIMIELDVETQKHILIRNKTSLKTTALSCTKINTKSTLLHKKCFSVLYWRKKYFQRYLRFKKKIFFILGNGYRSYKTNSIFIILDYLFFLLHFLLLLTSPSRNLEKKVY